MSHGGGGESSAEPNLTPLLDLVLQLLMFFMMCVNFTEAVTNTGERLPWSETVKPLARDGTDPLILSVKPFRMASDRTARRQKPDGTFEIVDKSKIPDDFTYFTEKERETMLGRFKDDEVCIFIPTEQVPKGTPQDKKVRKLADMRLKLKELANVEREKERKAKAVAEKKKLEEIPPVDPNSKVQTPLHVRADGGVKNGEIYELTQLCKEAGFVNVKVRAILGTKEKY